MSVNSRARSERGHALLAEVLGRLVGQPLVKMQTLEQFMAAGEGRPATDEPVLSAEERRSIVQGTLDKHYREAIDNPVPALGNKSPRALARSAKGRGKVVEWLKRAENETAKCVGSNEDMATYDFGWLWAELGVTEFRK